MENRMQQKQCQVCLWHCTATEMQQKIKESRPWVFSHVQKRDGMRGIEEDIKINPDLMSTIKVYQIKIIHSETSYQTKKYK